MLPFAEAARSLNGKFVDTPDKCSSFLRERTPKDEPYHKSRPVVERSEMRHTKWEVQEVCDSLTRGPRVRTFLPKLQSFSHSKLNPTDDINFNYEAYHYDFHWDFSITTNRCLIINCTLSADSPVSLKETFRVRVVREPGSRLFSTYFIYIIMSRKFFFSSCQRTTPCDATSIRSRERVKKNCSQKKGNELSSYF